MKLSTSLVLVLLAQHLAAQDAVPVPARPDNVLRFGDQQEHAYAIDFFAGLPHDESIPTPDALLGRRHGDFLARHGEILECMRVWAEASPHEMGNCTIVILTPQRLGGAS